MRFTAVVTAVFLGAFAVGATAHHGWGEYDPDKTLELTGTIKGVTYEQPHGHISLQTKDKLWDVVLAPPSRMENRGLAQSMLQPGTQAIVVGYPNRGKPDEMRAERITVGGKTVELR